MADFATPVEPVEPIPETSAAERVVTDALAIGASGAVADRVRDSVPLWFHTIALAPAIYTPGIARDHGYRLAVLGAGHFAGRSVLDVGAFDGFYSFLRRPPVRGALWRSTMSSTSSPPQGLRRLVGLDEVEVIDELEIDGHPRILALLRAAG